MPYFETGTPVPFTAADQVQMLTVALQGQHIGVYGYETQGGAVDSATVNMLNNFTQQNLTDIAAQIGSNSTTAVDYMRMSWNLSGSTVTDLVVGVVVTIGTVPNNGQDIINAMMVQGPLQYLLAQITHMDYKAYIIGTPPVGTYHQTITVTGSSDKSVPLSNIISEYGTEQAAIDDLRNKFIADAKSKYEQALTEQGYTVTVISANVLNIELVKDQNNNCTLAMTMELTVDSNKPILLDTNKTFDARGYFVVTATFIILLVSAIILAISVPILIWDLVKSWTTKRVVITEKKYGWIVDPVTGQRTWGVVSETTSDITSPDYMGILTVAVGGVILIGGLMFVSNLLRKRDKK